MSASLLLVGGADRSRLRSTLGDKGFSVVEVASPQSAMSLFKEAAFDGIVVRDEARQLALRGLCSQVKKSAPETRIFVLLTPSSDSKQLLEAAGESATLVPADATHEDVAEILLECFGTARFSEPPSLDEEPTPPPDEEPTPPPDARPIERGALLDKSRLWELHLARRGNHILMIGELSEQAEADAELRAALLRGANLSRRIEHPNLPRVFEVGETNDRRPWVLMEHAPGNTLHQLRKKLYDADVWFHPATAAFIVHELLGALEAVHDAKLAHGDVVPHAVWLAKDGRVWLLHTGTGSLVRKLEKQMRGSARMHAIPDPYLAPETIADGAIDSKSDLFVAGALLYELLSGDPLFLRDDATHTTDAIEQCQVPDLDRAIPASLNAATKALLQRDPDLRPKSAAAARQMLVPGLQEAMRGVNNKGLLGKLFGGGKKRQIKPGPVDPKRELAELLGH